MAAMAATAGGSSVSAARVAPGGRVARVRAVVLVAADLAAVPGAMAAAVAPPGWRGPAGSVVWVATAVPVATAVTAGRASPAVGAGPAALAAPGGRRVTARSPASA